MDKETGRVEAFSDGVFAVAITLLVLDIHVPLPRELGTEALWTALRAQWPNLLAYVTSFLTILVMWMNHDKLFEQIQRKDQRLLLYNGLLLMVVTLIPFPTALLAEYIQTPNAKTAAAIYCGTNLLMALAFNLLWRYAAADARLLAENHDRHRIWRITQQYKLGPPLYLLVFALVFVSVPLCLSLALTLAVFFALPERPSPPTQKEPEVS